MMAYDRYFRFGAYTQFLELCPDGDYVQGLTERARRIEPSEDERLSLLRELRCYRLSYGGASYHENMVYHVEESGNSFCSYDMDSSSVVSHNSVGDSSYRYLLRNGRFEGLLMTGQHLSGGGMSEYRKDWHFILYADGRIVGKNTTYYSCTSDEFDSSRDYTYTLLKSVGTFLHVENGILKRYYGDEECVTVPDGVHTVAPFAFANLSRLKEVILPDSVKTVGSHAFANCPSLESIRLPSGIETIGEWAFAFCPTLSALTLPNALTSLGAAAFYKDSALCSLAIPDGITALLPHTFDGCRSLAAVTLPQALHKIGDSAFHGCSLLSEAILPDTVNKIGYHAFSGCSSLARLRLPDTVSLVEADAFSDCPALETITAPKGFRVGKSYNSDPDGATDLEKFVIENGVIKSYIGKDDTVVIPRGVTAIANRAFYNLAFLKRVRIPDSVTEIGVCAFGECPKLKEVTLPAALREISSLLFYHDKALKSVTLPGTVTAISPSAFNGCSSLKAITLPEGLLSIGDSAFTECRALEEVILPATLTRLGEKTFAGCSALHTCHMPIFLSALPIGLFAECQSLENLTLPEDLTVIRDRALIGCALSHLTLPDTVEEIGEYALARTSFSYLTLPDSLETLGAGAFFGSSLREVILPDGIKALPKDAFSYSKSLKRVIFGQSVEDVDAKAFSDCDVLSDIRLSPRLKTVGNNAFMYTAMTKIVFPAAMRVLGYNALGSHTESIVFESKDAVELPHRFFHFLPTKLTVRFGGDAGTFLSMLMSRGDRSKPFSREADAYTYTVICADRTFTLTERDAPYFEKGNAT